MAASPGQSLTHLPTETPLKMQARMRMHITTKKPRVAASLVPDGKVSTFKPIGGSGQHKE